MSLTPARRSGVYPSAATQNARTAATSAASRKSWAKRGSPGSAVAPSSRAAVWRRRGEVGEVELEAVGVVLPLVLAAVEDHEPGAQVDQQREARVVGQRRRCGGQVALLRRRGGAVARHRAEHRLPVGRPGPSRRARRPAPGRPRCRRGRRDRPRTAPYASPRPACSTAAAGRTTSRWMRFRNGRGSVDCRIRIAGSRRNGSARPPSSPGA